MWSFQGQGILLRLRLWAYVISPAMSLASRAQILFCVGPCRRMPSAMLGTPTNP
ncbi:hypothetical protein M758_UG051000 [Ceratodon purpureus]|nr:hypothetical protein M758_UG051000 [Ceratodon purpureus]